MSQGEFCSSLRSFGEEEIALSFETFGVRTSVTFLFGPLILLAAWLGGLFFFALVGILIVLAMHEFYALTGHKGTHPLRLAGIVAGILLLVQIYLGYVQDLWLLLAAAFVVFSTVELFRNTEGPMLNLAATFLGVLYVALPFSFLILTREITNGPDMSYAVGGDIVITLFLCIWICDSAAYILGSRFGRHKLFPRVSPNKSVEGTVFGFLFAVLTAYVCQVTFLGELSLLHALVVGGICGSFGQASDLIESLFKRDAGVKDASNLIPGHGGVLDRFDSEILVAPVVYFYLRFVVF